MCSRDVSTRIVDVVTQHKARPAGFVLSGARLSNALLTQSIKIK